MCFGELLSMRIKNSNLITVQSWTYLPWTYFFSRLFDGELIRESREREEGGGRGMGLVLNHISVRVQIKK